MPTEALRATTHTEHEDHPWTISIPDHPKRADSDIYKASRAALAKITAKLQNFFGQQDAYQDHHGGGLWLKDDKGWFIVKNIAGLEWSSQFCADPRKVDQIRVSASRLYAGFPSSLDELQKLVGKAYDVKNLLAHKIETAEDVAAWCDSIFNASVPLAQAYHTGALKPDNAKTSASEQPIGGVHHYPTPITDIQLFKQDEYQLWVLDDEGHPAAVVPVQHLKKGNKGVRVVYATPGSRLHAEWLASHQTATPEPLVKTAEHSLARQAFQHIVRKA